MIYIFEVYDSKAETFSTPFFATNAAVGSRMFGTEANNPNSTIGLHPSDFTLFEVGSIDNGKWSLYKTKKNLGLAVNFASSNSNLHKLPTDFDKRGNSAAENHYELTTRPIEEA